MTDLLVSGIIGGKVDTKASAAFGQGADDGPDCQATAWSSPECIRGGSRSPDRKDDEWRVRSREREIDAACDQGSDGGNSQPWSGAKEALVEALVATHKRNTRQ